MGRPGFLMCDGIRGLSLPLQLREPILRRFCLSGESMDAEMNFPGGRGGHQRYFIFGLQAFAGNQATKGAMQKRIGKLIHELAHVLILHGIFVNAVHIPLIPAHRLSVRRQNHIFLRSASQPFSLGPPALQCNLRVAGCRTLDINMDHRTIRIDPKADRTFQITHGCVDGDASRFKVQFLPEFRTFKIERLIKTNANPSQLQQLRIRTTAAKCIAFREIENQISSRLHPYIRCKVAIADRHGTVVVFAG